MTDTLSHRGPDGTGFWLGDQAAFGHQRLAVIDPEHGHQPIGVATSAGKIALTYNGETYNAHELRDELKGHGHAFQTNTDTEVVLKGYEQWGAGVFGKMRGMFGVAVWDERQRKLVMARDRAGEKPLYYSKTPDGVVFGSEAKSLLAHPDIKPAIGLAGWQELFAASKTPGSSIWSGMQEVKPGSIVTVSENGIKESYYWRLQSREHDGNYRETVARVRKHLERIVHEQLVADVPVGSLLSGGIDSSFITALAAREHESLATYTIDYADYEQYLDNANIFQRGHDRPFAQDVADQYQTNHTVVMLQPLQLASEALRKQTLLARDGPRGVSDNDISRWLLYQKTREHCTVALTGENADELFGGYTIFFDDEKVLRGHGWSWDLHNPKDSESMLAILNPDFVKALDLDTYNADTYTTAISEIEPLAGESALDRRRREINYLEITRHTPILLEFVDRLSMGNGLEIRNPYCDPELMDDVYNTPWSLKAPDSRVKGLLIDAAGDLLPESVLNRPKKPFPIVLGSEYKQEIQRQGRILASQKYSVFDIISRKQLLELSTKPDSQIDWADRYAINLALEMALWIDLYKPSMTTS
jgi:asparagine synthase (glutamine-hydrolysing)